MQKIQGKKIERGALKNIEKKKTKERYFVKGAAKVKNNLNMTANTRQKKNAHRSKVNESKKKITIKT